MRGAAVSWPPCGGGPLEALRDSSERSEPSCFCPTRASFPSRTHPLRRPTPFQASAGPVCHQSAWEGPLPSPHLRHDRPHRWTGCCGAGAAHAAARGEAGQGPVHVDVVVVGAGIIGLSVAAELLGAHPDVTLAVLDARGPCAGATGAGQGYIWMGHRTPGTATWDLARYSKEQWESHLLPRLTAATDAGQGLRQPGRIRRRISAPPSASPALGWKKTGSLLFTTTPEQNEGLQRHVAKLEGAGVHATLLSAQEAQGEEPALRLPPGCTAALVPEDAQIDAILVVEALLQLCSSYGGRYTELFDEEVRGCLWESGRASGVKTAVRTVHAARAVVVCSGAWAASFLCSPDQDHTESFLCSPDQDHTESTDGQGQSGGGPDSMAPGGPGRPPVKPRKGHLLEVSGLPWALPLRHGLMEFEYTRNYKGPRTGDSNAGNEAPSLDVSMTATADHRGHLLLGSSREFAGFDDAVEEAVVGAILRRAAEFLPALAPLAQQAGAEGLPLPPEQLEVRVGLRPWGCTAPVLDDQFPRIHWGQHPADGRPLIGPVEGAPGLFLAVGHEGSGLTLAPGTSGIIASLVLEQPLPVDASPFLPHDRLK